MSVRTHKTTMLTVVVVLATFANQAQAESLELQVSRASDDGEEYLATGITLGFRSSDLELGSELHPAIANPVQVVGIRFQDVAIPPGSTIDDAVIQFTVDESDKSTAPANLVIWGERSPNPRSFGTGGFDITRRERTSNTTLWLDIPRWSETLVAGPDQATPDLSAIVQEVVDQPDWSEGNSMVFAIAPYSVETGAIDPFSQANRTAVAFDRSNGSGAPRIRIDFTPAAEPTLMGDYNGNGTVEQADLDLVLLNWGITSMTAPDGWINDLADGAIDQNELDKVLLGWGDSAGATLATGGVPEPAAIQIVALLAGCLYYWRHALAK